MGAHFLLNVLLQFRTFLNRLLKKQLMSFLSITSYCRNFILNYSFLEAPLGALIHGKGLQSADHVLWTTEAESAFTQLKLALQTAPTLGIPDPHKPFIQAVDGGCMILCRNMGAGKG